MTKIPRWDETRSLALAWKTARRCTHEYPLGTQCECLQEVRLGYLIDVMDKWISYD